MQQEKIGNVLLSRDQRAIVDLLESTHDNYFITGKAGTGKTSLLTYFANNTTKNVAILAPTGIAALTVGGQTIHSFFGLDTSVQNPDDPKMLHQRLNEERVKKLSSLDVLIIDEVSMVRVDIMDMIDRKMRVARLSDIPFGGCQLLLFGDLFQLPPVVDSGNEIDHYLRSKYGTVFFFGAPACKDSPLYCIELTTVFRQNDPAFIDMLNHIRSGHPKWEEIQELNKRQQTPVSEKNIITLTARNDAAQRINETKLEELKTPLFYYEGEIEGSFEEEELPTSMILSLRVGAQVMLIRNDPKKRWYNGTLCQVVALSDKEVKVEIDGYVYSIDKEVWVKYSYVYDSVSGKLAQEEVGSFRQFPIRLAYAITIHKSQGQTLESVIIDYSQGGAFAPGQTYVALSRCKSYNSLYLAHPLAVGDVRVSQEIVDYLESGLTKGREWAKMIGKDMQVLYGQRFSDSAAALQKNIRAKIEPTINQLINNPELAGLHVEKVGEEGLFSARVDDNYRLIFSVAEKDNLLFLLFVGAHEAAYQFANKYKLEINPITGSLQQVEKAPRRISNEQGTLKRLSRLAALSNEQLVSLDIPEEYWPQLREKVYTVGQLVGFKNLIPEETYATLEFILDGAPVDEAMDIWSALVSTVTPAAVEEKEPLFAHYTAEELVSVGIPNENVDKVRRIKTDKELEIIASTLPVLAQQSLYALKAGEAIDDIRKATFSSSKRIGETDYNTAINSPLTLAEFAPIHSDEALKAILEYPSEKWRVFLHPTQSEIIRQDYNGPARIVGGAGTGKTVVIVHRAKRLAEECTDGEKILVTTFGNTLKHDIDERIHDLCSEQTRKHIVVFTVDKLTMDLSKQLLKASVTYPDGIGVKLVDIWKQALAEAGTPNAFETDFCVEEWRDVIQAQHISTLEGYLNAQRYGRGIKMEKVDRDKFWKVAEKYQEICKQKRVIDADWAQNLLVDVIRKKTPTIQYKSVMVDECQDLRAPALRMLRALAGEQHKNDMYLSGDSRQRIYGGRVTLSQCGIAINNRSRILKLNYRTTSEIYDFAMQLQKDYQYDDMDGNSMSKDQSTCIFHGPTPFIRKFRNPDEEAEAIIRDIRGLLAASVPDTDICIMVKTNQLLAKIRSLLESKGLELLYVNNRQPDDKSISGIRIMSMHRGKGMEFSYVYLPSLQQGILPNYRDIERAKDDEMLKEVKLKEANLLSVAITRAKRQVWLSYSGRPSELIMGYIS